MRISKHTLEEAANMKHWLAETNSTYLSKVALWKYMSEKRPHHRIYYKPQAQLYL